MTPSCRLAFHIQPKASRNQLAGRHGTAIKIRITAPPVDGKANECLLRFLAATLKLPHRNLTLVHGTSSRDKWIDIQGLTESEVLQRLNLGG